jgi:LmbE family N-acetylglucosaminyl deacetylase
MNTHATIHSRHISQHIAALVLAALAVLAPVAPVAAQSGTDEHEGTTGLGLALRHLGTTARALMIGAHPDDENTALIAQLALGDGVDVAYLSLSRGEGGQNLIGPELGEGLGIIRSEELLAARRLDGAQQFFTRAYDFGFSKTAAESFSHWPRDSVLADMVAVIRKYRPDILIPVFSGTPRDGHGQHQESGILAREAFTAAGDPSRFPEQIRQGLRPWQPKYIFQSEYRPDPNAPIHIQTGDLDPLLGRSHNQIAAASRSRHRSQDMGQAQPLGPREVSVILVGGDLPKGATSLFAGVDTTLAQRAADLHDAGAAVRARLVAALTRYDALVGAARTHFNPFDPEKLVPGLAEADALLERADSMAARVSGAAAQDLRFRIDTERQQAFDATWRAANLVLDATSDDQRVVPGQDFTLTLRLWNGSHQSVPVVRLMPVVPSGWNVTPLDQAPAPVAAEAMETLKFRVHVAADAPPTMPYYLRQPRDGDLYHWPDDPDIRNLPFQPAAVNAVADVRLVGVDVPRRDAATYVDVDKAVGERRRPILVVPAVSVVIDPRVAVVPFSPGQTAAANGDGAGAPRAAAPSREFTVTLVSEATSGVSGHVVVQAPAGWTATPDSMPVSFAAPGETRTVRFRLQPPATPSAGQQHVDVAFVAADGQRFTRGYQVIDYPHIHEHMLYHDASALLSVFAVNVPAGLHVGYIMGAGDDGPDALRQLGVTVDLLEPEDLASGDLSHYDAIVTGIRAYEVRPDLDTHNDRLLDYVRNGGALIVQYNKYEIVQGHYTPYPITMARPHDRVTDENAPVKLLDPDNPVLSRPNRITPADFQGWIQDKGLYFAHTWDSHYEPLLEMHDPGDPPLQGGLLYAHYGKGVYVYTGLAFFRQWPDGVPGAYRLLANLVGLEGRQ